MSEVSGGSRLLRSFVAVIAAASIPAVGAILSAPAAFAAGGVSVTVDVERTAHMNSDPKPGHSSFYGLVCQPGRKFHKIGYHANVDLTGFWNEWNNKYTQNSVDGVDYSNDPVSLAAVLEFGIPGDVLIDTTRLEAESVQAAFNAANPSLASVFDKVQGSIVGSAIVVSATSAPKLTVGELLAAKKALESIQFQIPEDTFAVPAERMRTDEPITLTDVKVKAQIFVNTDQQVQGDGFGHGDEGVIAAPVLIDRSSDAALAHEFESATVGKELPDEVRRELPQFKKFASEKDIVIGEELNGKTIQVAGGTWAFVGWDEKTDNNDGCAHFNAVGKWAFTPAPQVEDPNDQGQDQGEGQGQGQGQSQGQDQEKPKEQPKPSQETASPKGGLARTGVEGGVLTAAGLILAAGASMALIRRNNS